MNFSINRVNYAFKMKVQLCNNPESENRDYDSTPQYFLKPIKLIRVEKVAFTEQARHKGYVQKGNRFWKYRSADELTDEKVEEIWGQIKTSYPYGYQENDTPTYLKYILDVKQDEAFQSHYRRYWETHVDLQKKPILQSDGSYDQGHPWKYIEFEVDEIITVKFTKGTVPPRPTFLSPWAEYTESNYYEEPAAYSCHEKDINIYVREIDGEAAFYIDDFKQYPITLNSSNSSYNFHLRSGNGLAGSDAQLYWPSGGSYANWSGLKLSFASGLDGTHNGFDEYTNVQRIMSPEVHDTWYITVDDKDNSHPFYGNGSAKGFIVSGLNYSNTPTAAYQSPDLSLIRGHTYSFNQTGSSNDGHPLYISTDPAGENTEVFSSGVASFVNQIAPDGENRTVFTVPYDAPDTLYYQCQNHQYMGGELNISDPTAADGDKPGQTVRLILDQEKDTLMTYFSPYTGGMGGILFLKKECDGQMINF